ncbi:MAG: 16S rRNA (guanine(966)-N(2))-methyltransferase RsmD [Hyphomonadaceae bacterium]
MRIIGGQLRGRRITGPASDVTRPMVDRIRQALFNVLEHRDFNLARCNHVEGARVLDAFCGTGALALEALSRGAAEATLMDIDAGAVQVAKDNVKVLGLTERARVLKANATSPPTPAAAHDLVLLSPPYYRNLLLPALAALSNAGWIAPDALIVGHVGEQEHITFPDAFALQHERLYGDSRFYFLTQR